MLILTEVLRHLVINKMVNGKQKSQIVKKQLGKKLKKKDKHLLRKLHSGIMVTNIHKQLNSKNN